MKQIYKTRLSKDDCIKIFKGQEPYKKPKYDRQWTFSENIKGNLTISTKEVIALAVFLWPFKYCFMRVVCNISENEKTIVEIKTELQKTDIILSSLIVIDIMALIESGFDFLKLYSILLVTLVYGAVYYLIASSRRKNTQAIIEYLKRLFELEEET